MSVRERARRRGVVNGGYFRSTSAAYRMGTWASWGAGELESFKIACDEALSSFAQQCSE